MVIFSYIEYLKYSRIIKEEYSLNEEVAEYKYDNKKINHIHDKTFRKILDDKKEFTIFINKIFNLEEKLEEKDIEKYNRKFVSVDYTNQESDVIYKLKNKEIFILVEHQTKIDKKMPIRILKYELEIIRSRMDENNRLEFPIIIPIVLYTGKQRWNAKINYPSYNSELARYRGLKKVEYNLVDINDYTIEDLYKENSILTKIMILEKSNKYIEIINNVDKIVNKVYDSELYTQTQKEMLLNILNNTMINIVGNKKMKEYKIKLEGGENMLALYEMIENERNEIYSTGIKEGKVKGKIEGKIEGIKAIAKKMLRMKFDKDTIMKATGIKEEELEKLKKYNRRYMHMENILNNSIELNNNLEIEKEQKNFLETTLGKTINTGIDIGIRAILPDYIEEQIIDLKDNLIKYGLKEGIKKSIDDAINIGKSAIGIVSGNFENIAQMQEAIKNGGIIDNVSSLLDSVINKVQSNGLINSTVARTIKQGKNSILNNVEKNIENTFNNQIKALNYTEKYIENWKDYFENKDFDGMEKEYKKIKTEMNYLAPIEKMINEARTIENLHMLIKNNGQDFNLTKEQMELAEKLQ